MARKRSWTEKIANAPAPHVEVLERPFAGLPTGARLYISSPREIAEFIARLGRGEAISIQAMRGALAKQAGADGTCPLTTGIFTRIVAEAALEKLDAGAPAEVVTPFWRVLDPNSPLAKKLSCGPNFIRAQQEAEYIA